ncbi:MAG: DUF2064 domain-containing protein [Bacteroidota bacterium]
MFVDVIAKTTHIAILYFSRSAESERRYKHWFSSKNEAKNQVLAEALIQQSKLAAQKTGLPVFHFHEGNQKGANFGERLANAYQEIFNQGYDAVVAIGNDIPELHKTNWNWVFDQLSQGNNILGPTTKGGAYLIGLTKKAFNKSTFQALPWQTYDLFEALKQYCFFKSCTLFLKVLRDVNTLKDLLALKNSQFLHQHFRTLIFALISSVAKIQIRKKLLLAFRFRLLLLPMRAPPF